MRRTVRAAQGRLGVLSVFHRDSILYGAFLWARRLLDSPKRRFLARAENSFVEGLDFEAENHARSAFHPDAQEAGAAFVEKRTGNFSGAG